MEVQKGKLLQRLLRVQITSDSISSLSHYCQSFPPKDIVPVWFDALRKCGLDTIKPLFYLANDIVQRTRGNPQTFVAEFAKVLEKAAELSSSRSPAVAPDLSRLFNIWKDRQIYSAHFMEVLSAAATAGAANPTASEAAPVVAEESPRRTAPAVQPIERFDNVVETEASTEDSSMATILAGSLQEAINEAQRRHRISIAVMQLLSSVKPQYKDGTFAADTLGEEDAAKVLSDVQAAEKHARYALAIARMNTRRRPATIAKLSEALATESEKLQTTLSNVETYQELRASLATLSAAIDDGKNVRARLQSGLSAHEYGAVTTDDYWNSFADLGQGPAAQMGHSDPLMADNWQQFGTDDQAGAVGYDQPAYGQPQPGEWGYGGVQRGEYVTGMKRQRPAEATFDYGFEYPPAPVADEGTEGDGNAPAPSDTGDNAPQQLLQARAANIARQKKKARILPAPVAMLELDEDGSNGGAQPAQTEAVEASEPFDLKAVIGTQVWNPILQAFVSADETTKADDSWRDH
jgi:hypothetical protein